MFNKGFLFSILTPSHLSINILFSIWEELKSQIPYAVLQWISFPTTVLQEYAGKWSLWGFLVQSNRNRLCGTQDCRKTRKAGSENGQELEEPGQLEPQMRSCHGTRWERTLQWPPLNGKLQFSVWPCLPLETGWCCSHYHHDQGKFFMASDSVGVGVGVDACTCVCIRYWTQI